VHSGNRKANVAFAINAITGLSPSSPKNFPRGTFVASRKNGEDLIHATLAKGFDDRRVYKFKVD
jgi:hypothetical protein